MIESGMEAQRACGCDGRHCYDATQRSAVTNIVLLGSAWVTQKRRSVCLTALAMPRRA